MATQTDVTAEVIVAGHICLDIIPTFEQRVADLGALLKPGSLVKIGPAVIATGGAISNTGQSLHRLGVRTSLMGKVGDDVIGRAILDVVRGLDPALATGMIVSPGEPSSYTVVINPPGIDRMFLHCPGVNDTFGASDVDDVKLGGARLFHFGYPPIMRRMYRDNGAELESLFRRVKQQGLTTSLDMVMPDPSSEAGQLDWVSLLRRVLPHVDVFLPSLEEILFMLDRSRFDRLAAREGPAGIIGQVDAGLLRALSDKLLAMGVPVVVIKTGDQGLYVRTTTDETRLRAMGACAPVDVPAWVGQENHVPCFEVNVAGTTGSGDATIAGFLAGLVKGLPLRDVMTTAVAVGATCCEKPDATSGVPDWASLQTRVLTGWPRRPTRIHVA
jgi:sugar/nucleoside kinase (ribokinase family)